VGVPVQLIGWLMVQPTSVSSLFAQRAVSPESNVLEFSRFRKNYGLHKDLN